MNGVVNEGKYKGIVMQIEYQDKQLVDELSITIEEIKDWDHTQKPAKILENLTKV